MSKRNLAYQNTVTDSSYLKAERQAFEKSELVNGVVVAMAGASENHQLLVSNLSTEILISVKKTSCRAFTSDTRIKAQKGSYYYPDIVVTCGEREYEDEKRDVLLNPKIIIEVLSETTMLKDRNEKFDSYTSMPSATDYVLIEQNIMRVEHFSRTRNKEWKVKILTQIDEILKFPAINCEISLEEIYYEIKLSK